jgi:hypothetical protein
MGEQNILREYLISLGFKVDSAAKQHFSESLTKWDKSATRLGRSLVGVAVGAQAMATEFAFRMERVYYASKLAESSAGNLQALDFGGKQAGIKDFAANVTSLARSIRANPGLQGLLNSLGVKVEGRDKSDVMKDFVKATKDMPHFIGQQYAALFGIDPDEYLLMKDGLALIEQAAEQRKQLAADLGIDTEKAAQAGLEFAREWREILMNVGLFRDAVSLALLGPMKDMADVTKGVLQDWIRIVQVSQTAGKVTPESARQSGLTVEEQKEMARRTGPAADAMRKKEEGQGLFWRGVDKAEDLVTGALSAVGLAPANPYGGAELSSSAKERLGEDRLSSSNPQGNLGFFGRTLDALRTGIGYRTRAKEKMDPTAIEVTTAPLTRAPEALPSGFVPVPAAPSQPVLGAPGAPQATEAAPGTPAAVIQQQEREKGLPRGFLDFIWNRESHRSTAPNILGPETKSGEHAKGPFQFMDGTAKEYGAQNPFSFGEAAPAAASYLRDLMKKYGDMRFAAAAYNWGPGKLDKLFGDTMAKHGDWSQGKVDEYVLGHLPEETRKYISGLGADSVQGDQAQTVNINADTKISVTEAQDAGDIARRVAESQHAVWSNVAREFSPKVR